MSPSARERVIASTTVLQAWLARKQASLPQEAWETLRQSIDAWLNDFALLVERGAWAEAERSLNILNTRYHIPGLTASGAMESADLDTTNDHHRGMESRGNLESLSQTRSVGSALQRIRILLTPASPPAIETYPEVRTPARVVEHTVFAVEITSRSQPTPHTGEKMTLLRRRGGAVDLEVALLLPETGLSAESPAVGVLRLDEKGSAPELVFRVRATAKGV